jgi:hypothetical protein
MTVTRWCSDCAAEAAFERFDCAEHPEDCVELVCVLCGGGVELPPAPVKAVPKPARASSAA